MINDYPNRIPLQKVQQAVWNILLSLGICPGGTNYWALNFRRNQSEIVPWWECFDWTAEEPQPNYVDDAVTNHITRMQGYLASELMYALFPHVARTLEGLGQGWVTTINLEILPRWLFRQLMLQLGNWEDDADILVGTISMKVLQKLYRGM